jgi:hypothetical protein
MKRLHDSLYRNGTKTNAQLPPIQGALAQVSATEPNKVHPQWLRSFLAAYGTVPCNDRRLLVEPEARGDFTAPSRCSHHSVHPVPRDSVVLTRNIRFRLLFSSARWITGWRTAARRCAFRNTCPRRWRSRASDLRPTCDYSREGSRTA